MTKVGIEMGMTWKAIGPVGVGVLFAAVSIAAQTVTASGGTANSVPKFSNGTTLVNSVITESNGKVGIGRSNPSSVLDLFGLFHVSGDSNPSTTSEGAYVTWNVLTGGTGETDFINNPGSGGGGFAFMKTPQSGTPRSTLMFINGGGNVGIGTTNPLGMLHVAPGAGGEPGGFVVTGMNIDPGSNIPLTPFQNSGALITGWNRSGGGGEADFIANRANGGSGGFNFYDYTNAGVLNLLASFQGNGNLGIVGNVMLSGQGSYISFPDGSTQNTAWAGTACGGDYAESVDVSGDRTRYEPGDVLVLDTENPGKILKSAEAYSTMVSGIYSTKPGLVGRRQQTPKSNVEIPMALVGIVPTKVSTENGPIKVGDLLVTSSTFGSAMKGTDRSRMLGAVVGKAMGNLDSGTGVIEVLVSLQ